MSLSKLTIFSKNTDASEVLKGYEYQKLRTLENWLSNKVNKVDEVIYCEYQDDIFQRDINSGKSKFTQVKLYGSKAFSFKSEEITKSIANFFILYVKDDYRLDEVQFAFETNTGIARKYEDNDAELLKKWFDNQENLDEALLQKCTEKVKGIVTSYIKTEFPKVVKKQKSEAQLDIGDEADKQYNLAFEAWKDVKEIKYFNLAEFLEVLHSANHCRQSTYLKDHSEFWLSLLECYIQFFDTPDRYKQKAIYEYLWLSLRPVWPDGLQGTLIGHDHLIEQYFSNTNKFDNYEDFDNHLSLIQLVCASVVMEKCDLGLEKTDKWLDEIGSVINSKVESIENPNEKCFWLEQQSAYLSNPLNKSGALDEPNKIFSCYDKLIELLPVAPLYNVSRLSDRINEFIKIYIQVGDDNKLIDRLEDIADRLMPFVTKKNGNHKTAKVFVERGSKYLESKNPHHFARALEYFHKAKDLWLQDETAEGYVLALLNISQLYSGLNMNMAAKYYALSAAWFSINNNPEKLAARIASAFGLLVYCDYKQGTWINALDSFKFYIRSRIDYDGRALNTEDEILMKSFIHVASILAIAPRVSVQLGGYIEYQKQQMGQLYKEFIEPLIPIYDEQVNKYGLQAHIQRHLYGSPVNDVGVTRIIEWKAFGSIWKISFPNTWQYNSLGEEFASVLQILLVELSNSSIDLHFIRTIIEIEIVASDDLKTPEQLPSNDTFKWKFFTQKVDANERSEIRFQMASLIIGMKYLLRDVSMLHDDKFFEIVDKLFQNEALAEKTMSVNLYQRIYRKLFIQEIFDASQRNVFTQELLQIELDEDPLLKWNSSLSHLYSERESLRHIEDRFKNTGIATHLTIDHIKTLPGYEAWLNNLHKKGWLDWQIILAMYNHICNYKANSMVGYKSFSSEELRKAAFDEEFHKIRNKDEQETYVEFPLDYFVGSEFNSQLNHSLWLVLHTWGLENRASFPNFPSIKDFLKNRFNVGIDDIKGLSPFI